MRQLSDFVGTWKASRGSPFADHTFTWQPSEDGLHGRWIIEAPDSPAANEAASEGRPPRIEISIDAPWLESGVLFFKMHAGPYISEFRLEGPDEAVVGAAVDKLPPEFAGPEYQRSIEVHRVRFTRQSEATA
jgi:hypothetical protein